MKFSVFMFMILLAGWSLPSGAATDDGKEAEAAGKIFEEYNFLFESRTGYHFSSISGYRGKVGEYEVLDPGAEIMAHLNTFTAKSYLDINSSVADKEDQVHTIELDAGRIVHTDIMYRKFKHYLDHDSLANQDFVSDFDGDAHNAIIREEFAYNADVRLPAIPNFTVTARYRQLNKRGHRQATTVSKCTQCHVSSRSRRINETTRDISLGAVLLAGPLSIDYRRIERRFHDSGDVPLAMYSNGASSFSVAGLQQYNTVADSSMIVDHIKANLTLPLRSTLYCDYENGKHRNRDTRHDRDFQSFAVRLSTAMMKYVVVNYNYFDYDMDTDVPGAMQRDVRRNGFSFKTRSWKKTFLRGSVRWEDIDRRQSNENSTRKKTLILSVFSRPAKRLTLQLRYRHERLDDPFAVEGTPYFQLAQTSVPTNKRHFRLACTWTPKRNLSLYTTFQYEDSESGRYDIDEKRMESMISLWYAPREDLIITGTYSLATTRLRTRTVYKTYHETAVSDFLLDPSVPYNEKSGSYSLKINYSYSRRLSFVGSATVHDSRADYDSRIVRRNIGQFSDITIKRLDSALGFDYSFTSSLSFYGQYNYRDYNDLEDDDLDGKVHYVGFGVNYRY